MTGDAADDSDRLVAELRDNLKAQIDMARAGDLTQLERLARHAEPLIQRFEQVSVPARARQLAQLVEAARRLAPLLEGAAHGVRDAQQRLAALHAPDSDFNSYGQSGNGARVGLPRRGDLERRA